MLPKRPWVVTVPLAVILIIVVSSVVTTFAQEDGACDIDALIEHQQEHAATLDSLEHMLHDDLDATLENLS